jgi:hypothetical protein
MAFSSRNGESWAKSRSLFQQAFTLSGSTKYISRIDEVSKSTADKIVDPVFSRHVQSDFLAVLESHFTDGSVIHSLSTFVHLEVLCGILEFLICIIIIFQSQAVFFLEKIGTR